MTFSYDDDADVLYVTFVEHNGPVVYLENESGDILRIALFHATIKNGNHNGSRNWSGSIQSDGNSITE